MEIKSLVKECPYCGRESKPVNMAEFYNDLDDTLIWECDCERPTLQ